VHGFDAEESAVSLCEERFAKNSRLTLNHQSFTQFQYPQADLINASRSLFFCNQTVLPLVWEKIVSALPKGGIFCGDFLGENDDWVVTQKPVAYITKNTLADMLSNFEVVECLENKKQGHTINGQPKYWHTYTIIAFKQ